MELNIEYNLREVIKDASEVLNDCVEEQNLEMNVMMVAKKLVKDYSS